LAFAQAPAWAKPGHDAEPPPAAVRQPALSVNSSALEEGVLLQWPAWTAHSSPSSGSTAAATCREEPADADLRRSVQALLTFFSADQ
ncbi:unnamed protein product, partial [Polarella glacialis]